MERTCTKDKSELFRYCSCYQTSLIAVCVRREEPVHATTLSLPILNQIDGWIFPDLL
ncbi:hypothetical protein FKM82_017850 [Ascaphus truei]